MNSIDLLAKLISFETASCASNRSLIDWVAAYLQSHGAIVTLLPEGDKACLWARLGPEVAGGVALAGHTDVVPVEGQHWASDPFTLMQREDRLYGRGACDMKGFLACALALVPHLSSRSLQKPLYIALTYDEETTMAGAKKLSAWLDLQPFRPDWFWVGEPTNMQIVNAHKGVVANKTRCCGVAAHSSMPQDGCNAIALASALVGWMEGRKNNLFEDSPFTPPSTTFNAGLITGGRALNIVPDLCEMDWEFRLHPGEDEGAIWADYQTFVEKLLVPLRARFPSVAIETETIFHAPPFANGQSPDTDDQIVKAVGVHEMQVASYATEASLFRPYARAAYICGPGSIAQAHKPDEYVTCDQMALCDTALLRMLDTLSPY